MNSFLKLILLTGLTCYGLQSKAQNEYVITSNGDTLKCEIKSGTLFNLTPRYKTATMTDFARLDPAVVKQYQRKKEKHPFRAVVPPNKKHPTYLEVLEEGKINLYEQVITSGAFPHSYTNTYWYASKGTDSLTQVKTSALLSSNSRKDRKQAMLNLISDNKMVLDQYVAADDFGFDQIRATIHYYNTGEPPKR
jgi:hypothetical protein